MSFKHLFSQVVAGDPERLHFAAHSHHYWLDATFEGHQAAAELARVDLDRKWATVFGELLPRLQARVASRLHWPDPSGLAFAPSTHEFLLRIVSSLEVDRPLKVLTTDGEFHAARRQLLRWQEAGRVEVTQVPCEPYSTFGERFGAALAQGGQDLVLFSHVMFDSGFVVEDLPSLVARVPDDRTEILIDGYHAFNAIPVDLSGIAERAFYTSGGYKYAMSGEGACFLACPPGRLPRPINTGWFAGFGALQGFAGEVEYAEGGGRFLGATLDPTGLFRLDAALGALDAEGLGPAEIHAHVLGLQEQVLADLPDRGPLSRAELLPSEELAGRGHFLCFRTEHAGAFEAALARHGVWSDHRRDRLRLGVALYHDAEDCARLVDVLDRVRRESAS